MRNLTLYNVGYVGYKRQFAFDSIQSSAASSRTITCSLVSMVNHLQAVFHFCCPFRSTLHLGSLRLEKLTIVLSSLFVSFYIYILAQHHRLACVLNFITSITEWFVRSWSATVDHHRHLVAICVLLEKFPFFLRKY